MRDLPIFEIEQRLLAAVAKQRRLIITAPTGSGKSTQVPQMLFRDDSQIVILQPRRLPTRMLAAWVAKDRGVKLGDELVVRLTVTSDRDYEFLELADHRPSLTEPVDVLSGWRYGDGVGWYAAVRDAATQLFFERLPRGTHVFEYSLRAAHRGLASSGFARIQSRYAPEFSAHSASIPIEVR